ncbi:ParB/RepB/Spo0J family partition protein [Chromobacterium haemolyticum]|uniref:ParB/RepB/Spo0J family partition protein n=1 Tax=Chromobacterium haemolyticum TaxID=394935 RepID=UPI00244D47A3|nr:ParB N-terminal domain-containing protein [Chromobacterium haemolyticum]MDH0341992.1 ParB N-terminal domain-containing protein [Chromobacterium haemolyticum]
MKQRRFTPPELPAPAFREGDNSTPDADDQGGNTVLLADGDIPATGGGSTGSPAEQVDQPTKERKPLALNLIDPNPLAPREVYTPEMLQQRAEELRTQGQHDPIHVIPHPDKPGRFIIADGWTRVQGCVEHKVFDELIADIHYDLSVQEAAWFGYEQNEGRQQHCDLDRAMFYEKQIKAGLPAAEVARRANLTKSMMTYYRAYARLPEDVLEVVRLQPEKFGSLVAYNLAKLYEKLGVKRGENFSLRKVVALANRYAAEDQTVRWLVNQVQTMLNPTENKPTTPLKHFRYANGYYKQSEKGFELLIAVPEEKRESFAIALESLLESVAVQQVDPSPSADAQEQS